MEEQKKTNARYQEIRRGGQEANETVRAFSIQVMEKAERNFGKIESLKGKAKQE